MKTRHELFAWAALALLSACDRSAGHGSAVNRAKCDTIEYEARSLSARVEVPQKAGVQIDTSAQAIREVDEHVEKYFAQWRTVCMDYRNGALTREEYREESQRIRMAMERFEVLALRLEKASTPEEFEAALKETWTAVLPEEQSVDITAEIRVMAKRPGKKDFSVAPPGANLPSGSEIFSIVKLSRPAHLQIYQVDAKGERVVLFPDARIPLRNPIPGGQEVRLPAGGVFFLDDLDLGLENLHVVASSDPPAAVAAAVSAPSSGGVGDCKTRGLHFVADNCPRTRGLTLGPDATGASLAAANSAGEHGVHLVYLFHHVGDPETYGKKCPDDPKVNCRGVEPMRSIIDRRPPQMPGNFEACPGDAAPKEMPGPEGSYERWCVETDAGKRLVDHGPYRKWYSSGQLWISGSLEMGRRVGTWTTFDSAGNKLGEITY